MIVLEFYHLDLEIWILSFGIHNRDFIIRISSLEEDGKDDDDGEYNGDCSGFLSFKLTQADLN